MDVKVIDQSPDTCDQFVSKLYPKTLDALSSTLEEANKYHPANVPVIIIKSYRPNDARSRREGTAVDAGMVVNALYKTKDYVFVRTPLEDVGFIPFDCVQLITAKKLSKDFSHQFPEDSVPILNVSSDHDSLLDSSYEADCSDIADSLDTSCFYMLCYASGGGMGL